MIVCVCVSVGVCNTQDPMKCYRWLLIFFFDLFRFLWMPSSLIFPPSEIQFDFIEIYFFFHFCFFFIEKNRCFLLNFFAFYYSQFFYYLIQLIQFRIEFNFVFAFHFDQGMVIALYLYNQKLYFFCEKH